MPLLLTALPLVILSSAGGQDAFADMRMGDMPAEFARVCGDLQGGACFQYYLVSQFMLLFLLMPLSIPVTIAAYSIVGEKTTRTLEPVLATPISIVELLLGKALAAVIPAVGATWISFAVFLVGVQMISGDPLLMGSLVSLLWLLAILVLGPLLSVAAVSVAVMVSSRSNDPRVAEQLSMLVILPLLGLFFGQIAGFIMLDQTLVIWMTIGMAFLDVALMAFAVHLFQRENILTRWR